LGDGNGIQGLLFIMILMVFKLKLSLNNMESSWGYLNNLNKSQNSKELGEKVAY
jgi:hypothetical protein